MCVFVGMPPFSNPRSVKSQCVVRETMQFNITTMDVRETMQFNITTMDLFLLGQYLHLSGPTKQFDNDKKLS